MMRGDAVLIHYLVGVAVKSLGLSAVRWLAAKPDVPTTVLLELNAKLEPLVADREALADALRVEFHGFVVPMLDRLRDNNPIDTLQQLTGESNDPLGLYAALKRNPKPFDREASRALFAEIYRDFVVAAAGRYSADAGEQVDRRLGELSKQVESPAKVATVPNAAGIMMITLAVPAMHNLLPRAPRMEVTTNCSRLLLVLRAYANDEKQLPATLADLMPKYLKAIPADSFDGKPLRYSKAERKVFSVGLDAPVEFAVKF
jgi:hypothetical protein